MIQSLKNLCQLIIRKILIIAWNKRDIDLPNIKYEMIENIERKIWITIERLFLITDIDKNVKPKDKKE